MEKRYVERRKALLAECAVPVEVFRGALDRLNTFAEPYTRILQRAEQREHAKTYLSGLLSDLKRKNTESIAYRHDQDRRSLQHFLGESRWDYAPLLARLRADIGRELGEPDGVIVFDPSGVKKQGTESVGVARQWLGRLGKVDNGQVGVYLGYVTRQEHALADMRLFLPREWCGGNRQRRRKCGVPKTTTYRTRHELALEMLDQDGADLPHAWVAGDTEMGRPTAFRRALRSRGETYLLAVPANTAVRDLEAEPPPYGGTGAPPKVPFQSVTAWAEALPESGWTALDVRDGEKGPLAVRIAKRRVLAKTERGRRNETEELLVAMWSRDENGTWEVAYSLSNANPEMSLEELARVAKAEHRIEECLERAKGEAGLADYEVRTWHGWHHHQTLSLLAVWFLTREARRGKKTDAGADGAADSRTAGEEAA